MAEQELQSNEKIEELLNQLSQSRDALSSYMADVDSLRRKVDGIFPNATADFRNKFVLEEKIKAASSFYSTLLNIRQEYNKTIKEEIEIRRKIVLKDDVEEIDVRELANMLENHQKTKGIGDDIKTQ